MRMAPAEWPLLAGLDDDTRQQILTSARRRRFGRNEIIFHEGDPGDTVHLVSKGHVAIRVTTPLGDTVTLTVLTRGESFGELALLGDDNDRTATAVAMDATETLSITRQQFDGLRRAQPHIERFLTELLAGQVRRLSAHLLEALYVPADKRVLRRLGALVAGYGAPAVAVTQEDLATMAGTTRPTANRVLKDAEDAGAIRIGRGRIEVLDEQLLERRAR
jgi:CRP/FNR family transcriptional regulator, cyclic AMP receptor protein